MLKLKLYFILFKNFKMERNISLLFSKLSPIQDKENYIIEITYNNNKKIISYPQDTPLFISFLQKTEKQIISINIKSKQINKKQKIVGNGEIILYKKFLTEKPLEKYIILYKENKDKKKIKSINNSIGKIFVQIKLDELSNINTQEKENDNNNNKDNINIEKNNIKKNETLKQEGKEIDLLKFDENILKSNNIDEFLSNKNIIKLKDIIENEKNLFPKDIISLKSFNQNLFNQCKLLNEKYNKILLSLSENNQTLEKNLNEIINKNTKIEQEIKNFELESNKKEQEIKQKIKELKEKNEIKKENNYSNEIINNNGLNNNKSKLSDINDVKDFCNIIKKLESLGYGISEGDLTDSEKQNLNDLLNRFSQEKKNYKYKEETLDSNELEILKDDFELGEKVISLIERDVNDLFSRKLIELVTIDQIDSISYIFSGKIKKKEVSFKLDENNNLICSTGETFTVWLVKNFSL